MRMCFATPVNSKILLLLIYPTQNAVSKTFHNVVHYLFVELFVANNVEILEEMQNLRQTFNRICT